MEQNSEKVCLSPTSLKVDDLGQLLSKVSDQKVTAAMIHAILGTGAPVNADGTINLVHFAAWLVKDMADQRSMSAC